MAKHKKRSNRKPVSRERIAQASYAKAHGLLSKTAKLQNNRLSRRVAKKIDALESVRAIPTFIFEPGAKRAHILDKPLRTSVAVKPALAKAMREQGYEVFRNRVIVPSGDKRYKETLKKGLPAGIKRIPEPGRFIEPQKELEGEPPKRVEANTIEVISLDTLGIENYADLHRALQTRSLEGNAKRDDELYSFSIYGFNNRQMSGFYTDDELDEYLQRYNWTEDKWKGFELVRMRMGDTLGPSPDWMYSHKKRKRSRNRRRDETMRKAKDNKMLSEEERISRNRESARKSWNNLKDRDPAKYEAAKKRMRDYMREKRGYKQDKPGRPKKPKG